MALVWGYSKAITVRTNQNALPHAPHQYFSLIRLAMATMGPMGEIRWLRQVGQRRSVVSGRGGSDGGMAVLWGASRRASEMDLGL